MDAFMGVGNHAGQTPAQVAGLGRILALIFLLRSAKLSMFLFRFYHILDALLRKDGNAD
jgi:hypothetical protein